MRTHTVKTLAAFLFWLPFAYVLGLGLDRLYEKHPVFGRVTDTLFPILIPIAAVVLLFYYALKRPGEPHGGAH